MSGGHTVRTCAVHTALFWIMSSVSSSMCLCSVVKPRKVWIFRLLKRWLSTKYSFQDLERHWPVETLIPFAKLKGPCWWGQTLLGTVKDPLYSRTLWRGVLTSWWLYNCQALEKFPLGKRITFSLNNITEFFHIDVTPIYNKDLGQLSLLPQQAQTKFWKRWIVLLK